MKQAKRWRCCLLAICLIAVLVPITARAADNNACGAQVTWSLSDDGVLTISGTGPMADYEYGSVPWNSSSEMIRTVVIQEGITSIGAGAFYWCSSLADVTIPRTVTSIGAGAFHYCTDLTAMTIGDNVTTIGDYAFYCCTALSKLTIGSHVSTIGNHAFYKCDQLTSVTLPASVSDIGSNVFTGCKNLRRIRVESRNANYSSDDYGVLFNKQKTELVQAPCGFAGSYAIPQGVTAIHKEAFRGCTGLTGVTFPAGVSNVGDSAFYGCTGLTEMRFCGTAPAIGANAFYNVKATAYYPPDDASWTNKVCGSYGGTITWKRYGASEIDRGICGRDVNWVLGEDGVLTISGEGKMENFDFAYEQTPWYPYRKQIRSVVIESGVTSIGSSVFQDCADLTAVEIPGSITSIGPSAFEGCTSLAKVVIPEGIDFISSEAFKDCTSLTGIVIPEGITTIYSSTFSGCTGLTSVTIPESVGYIGEKAFFDCSSLTGVQISAAVYFIGDYAFDECDSLTGIYVDLNNKVYTSDEYGVLFNKEKTELLKAPGAIKGRYTVPESVTDIYGYAFFQCKQLTGIDLPHHIRYINKYTFTGCTGLTNVVIPDGVTIIGWKAFENCTNLSNVIIPDSVTSLDSYAFCGCTGLTKVLLPDRLSHINYRVFENCAGLKEVHFLGNAPKIASNSFLHVKATAYYTPGDKTWTSDKRTGYGGKLTWVPFGEELDAPKVSVDNDASSGHIRLKWNAVEDVVKYEIYRAAFQTGQYKLIKTTGNTSYINSNSSVHPGDRFYYYVIAVAADGRISAPSNVVNCTCDLPQPTVSVGNAADSGKIRLTWTKDPQAVAYRLYYATSKNGTYRLLKTTTDTSHINTSSNVGKTYYYKVQAIHSNAAANSACSEAKSRTCDLPQPKVTLRNVASSGKIKVSWEKVAGAKGYKVYRATSKTGAYKLMKTTTGTSYTNTAVDAGKTYYYKVVAVHSNSAANSAYSEVQSRTCDLARPVVTVSRNSSGKPVIRWDAVSGAKKYTLYIYNSDGKLIKTTSTTGTRLTHGSATKGKTYSYRVVAVHSNTSANSAMSGTVSVKSK